MVGQSALAQSNWTLTQHPAVHVCLCFIDEDMGALGGCRSCPKSHSQEVQET